MQPEIYGPVRYVYQETEEDIEVIIEGESVWVKELVSDLSLDDKGWLQPLNSEENSGLNESLILEGENVGSMLSLIHI